MDKDLEEIVSIMLDVCPDKITTKDMSIIIINLLIHKQMAHHWITIQSNVAEIIIEHLIKSSLEADEHQNNITAIKDADNFLEGIVNGV
jgi:hypothetical protein|tara:strand:- start:118 stop:384 length:267 start_codon:yes stop_codon:yes gene_type:complete